MSVSLSEFAASERLGISSNTLPRVSVVLLSHNRPEMLRQSLHSLVHQSYPNLDITVVDNFSDTSDQIAEVVAGHHGIKLIQNSENLGYTGGMNRGITQASGDYVFLTEDDVVLQRDCIEQLLGYLSEHESVEIISPILYAEDQQTIHCAGGHFDLDSVFKMKIYGAAESDQGQFRQPFDVNYLSGSSMFSRREFWRTFKGFREDYFMYSDDVELCARVARAGGRMSVVPQAKAYHFEALKKDVDREVSFHQIKNFVSLYLLHAPLRNLPEFTIRYVVGGALKSMLGRSEIDARTFFHALFWVAGKTPSLLSERRNQPFAKSTVQKGICKRPNSLIRDSVRNAVYAIAPQFVVERYIRSKMLRQARHIGRLGGCSVDRSLVDALWSSHFFRPLQKESEILRLIEVVGALEPSKVCEIGAAGGGTTLLLARAATTDATIVTIDLGFTNATEAAVHHLVGSDQKIFCLARDSHHSETVAEVRKCVEGAQLDVLYLDGDHSYEGIQTDFKLYTPLVRQGGLVVFHDIVPDYKTRYGIATTSDVGGVPQFWEEIKASGATVEEIIDDPGQDGYGIGILHWNISSSYQ